MKFYDFETFYSSLAKTNSEIRKMKQSEFYGSYFESLLETKEVLRNDKREVESFIIEKTWIECGRPYYNVWPILLKAALKLDLSKVKRSDIHFPEQVILIRFSAEEHKYAPQIKFEGQVGILHTMMIGFFEFDNRKILKVSSMFKDESGIVEISSEHELLNANDYFKEFDVSVVDADLKTHMLKIAVILGIISNNPDLITPDYIKSDIPKVTEQTAEHYHNRAKKAGKYGWNVGEILHKDESSPHFRMPHLALYWTGEGRQIPKIILRTGPNNGPIPVRRDKITTIPTGYYDKEPQCQ